MRKMCRKTKVTIMTTDTLYTNIVEPKKESNIKRKDLILKLDKEIERNGSDPESICDECGNDHSFHGNPITAPTIFDYLQELLNQYAAKKGINSMTIKGDL